MVLVKPYSLFVWRIYCNTVHRCLFQNSMKGLFLLKCWQTCLLTTRVPVIRFNSESILTFSGLRNLTFLAFLWSFKSRTDGCMMGLQRGRGGGYDGSIPNTGCRCFSSSQHQWKSHQPNRVEKKKMLIISGRPFCHQISNDGGTHCVCVSSSTARGFSKLLHLRPF